jgi:uncharacterized phiE125 gp8 family phage protein
VSTLSLVTAPLVEPVTLAEAKRHLRVEVDDDDDLIQSHLEAARERAELETGRQFITATWALWLAGCPGGWGASGLGGYSPFSLGNTAGWAGQGLFWGRSPFLDLPKAPLQTIVSVLYVDTTGVTQTWDPTLYQVLAPQGPQAPRGRLQPAYGVPWPVTRDQLNAVTVTFTAGYGLTGASVPQMLRRAILMIAGDLYENREATVVTERRVTVQPLPYGVDQILQQYRARPITRAAA